MATAPTVVVAGDTGIGRKLRETRKFAAVFDVASAKELRHLSRRGEVAAPAAFMFAPGFVEDVRGAGVEVLANSLASNGFTVLVHNYFAERGDSFNDAVKVTERQVRMSQLLAALGSVDGGPEPEPGPPPRQEPASRPQPEPASRPRPESASQPRPEPAPRPRPEPAQQAEPAPPVNAARQATPPAPRTSAPPAPSQPPAQAQVWPPQSQPQPGWPAPVEAPPSPQPAPQTQTGWPTHVDTPPSPQAAPQPQTGWPTPVETPPSPQPAPQPQTGWPAHVDTPPSPQSAPQPQTGWPAHVDTPPSPQPAPQAPTMAPAPSDTSWPAAPQPTSAAAPHGAVPPQANGWTHPQPGNVPPAAAPTATKRGRVIAVASAKGGVGKTSVTVNLAIHASRILQSVGRGESVVLVDTNFQQADVARFLNVKSPTVLDLLKTSSGFSSETIRNQIAHVPQLGLYALLGPPEAINADPSLVNSLPYQRIINALRKTFDFVFIDTPVAEVYHTTFSDLILPAADAILVPVEPSRVTLEAVQSWLRAITMPRHSRGGGVSPEKLSLLLNRARADVDCSPEDVMDLLPGWRFVGMIPEDHEWMRAANNYQPIALRADPALDTAFRSILQVLTEDPIFGTAPIQSSAKTVSSRFKKILGLSSD
ncbi:AAA family ATPase [Actinoallomurus sp. NPDC052308]|uniref:AAA family ATPase n=1 Tax=Actinoallomurus sp. NPDC052308 TaxID=3155530 RepID=UPI00343D4649